VGWRGWLTTGPLIHEALIAIDLVVATILPADQRDRDRSTS
jgi:hypothetical protein